MRDQKIQQAVGRLAAASRNIKVQPGAAEAARQELQAARLERAITQALDPEEPYEPLNMGDRVRLAGLLLEDTDDE